MCKVKFFSLLCICNYHIEIIIGLSYVSGIHLRHYTIMCYDVICTLNLKKKSNAMELQKCSNVNKKSFEK